MLFLKVKVRLLSPLHLKESCKEKEKSCKKAVKKTPTKKTPTAKSSTSSGLTFHNADYTGPFQRRKE